MVPVTLSLFVAEAVPPIPTFPEDLEISLPLTVQLLKTAGVPLILNWDPVDMLMSPATSSLYKGGFTPIPTLSPVVAKWTTSVPLTHEPLSPGTSVSNDASPSKDPAVIRPVVSFITIPDPTLKFVCT